MGNLLMRFVANRAPNLYFPKIKKAPKGKSLWTLCNTDTEPTGSGSRILYDDIIPGCCAISKLKKQKIFF